MRPFHDLPTHSMSDFSRQLAGFLVTSPDMSRKPKGSQCFPNVAIVISLSRYIPCGFSSVGSRHSTTMAFRYQLGRLRVVAICAVNHDADQGAVPLRRQAAFDPAFASVGRILARFFPTERRLCHRPGETQPLPVNSLQLVKGSQRRLSKTPEKHSVEPRTENDHMWLILDAGRFGSSLPTDNWLTRHKKSHPHRPDAEPSSMRAAS